MIYVWRMVWRASGGLHRNLRGYASASETSCVTNSKYLCILHRTHDTHTHTNLNTKMHSADDMRETMTKMTNKHAKSRAPAAAPLAAALQAVPAAHMRAQPATMMSS